MPARPPWPPDVFRLQFTTVTESTASSFAIWMLNNGSSWSNPSIASSVIADWIANVQPAFLALMGAKSSFGTCRLSTMRPSPFSFEQPLGDNAGAGSDTLPIFTCLGCYVQTGGGGSGSGTRIRIAGIDAAAIDAPGQVNVNAIPKLQFLANTLAQWPQQLVIDGLGPAQLGTLRRRDGSVFLDPPVWDQAIGVRPSYRVEHLVRRSRDLRDVSRL